jgi:hypothetical protein
MPTLRSVSSRGLEVQGRDVVERQPQPGGAGGVAEAGLRDQLAVVARHAAFEAAHERHPRRRVHPELAQHADGVELAGRFHDPRHHQRPERLVADHGEPERLVDAVQGLPQQPRAGRLDHRRPGIDPAGSARVELQDLLAGVQPFPRDLLQQCELIGIMRRTDVINPVDDAAALVHDLHRRRARGGLHPAHERAHGGRLPPFPNPLSDHIRKRTRSSTAYECHDYTVVIQVRPERGVRR